MFYVVDIVDVKYCEIMDEVNDVFEEIEVGEI